MGLTLKLDEKGAPVRDGDGSWIYVDESGAEQAFADPLKLHAKNASLLDEIKKERNAKRALEAKAGRLAVLDELELEDDNQLRDLVAKGREALAGAGSGDGKGGNKDIEAQIAAQVAARSKEFERALAKLQATTSEAAKAAEAREKMLRSKLDAALIDGPGAAAFLAAKGKAKSTALFTRALRDHVKVVEEDGELHVRVFDEDGQVRYKGGTRNPMTIGDLAEEWRESETYSPLFDGPGVAGAGAVGSQGFAAGRSTRVDRAQAATPDRDTFERIASGEVSVR